MHCTIGNACHYQVVGSLCKKYPTPKEAEAHFLQVPKVSSSSSQSLSQISDSNIMCSSAPLLCTAAVQTETSVALQSKQCQTQLSMRPSSSEKLKLNEVYQRSWAGWKSHNLNYHKTSIPSTRLWWLIWVQLASVSAQTKVHESVCVHKNL